jgi:hypothetical protein
MTESGLLAVALLIIGFVILPMYAQYIPGLKRHLPLIILLLVVLAGALTKPQWYLWFPKTKEIWRGN